jgi:hypothetical protein
MPVFTGKHVDRQHPLRIEHNQRMSRPGSSVLRTQLRETPLAPPQMFAVENFHIDGRTPQTTVPIRSATSENNSSLGC